VRYTRVCFEVRLFTSEELKQYKLIIFMVQGFPREVASPPADQEIPRTLCKLKFHYQQPTTDPYPEPDGSSPRSPVLFV
jgi:hypothetical protein